MVSFSFVCLITRLLRNFEIGYESGRSDIAKWVAVKTKTSRNGLDRDGLDWIDRYRQLSKKYIHKRRRVLARSNRRNLYHFHTLEIKIQNSQIAKLNFLENILL